MDVDSRASRRRLSHLVAVAVAVAVASRSRRTWASDGGVWNEGDVELGRACAMRRDATRSIDALARTSSREEDARARDDDEATPLNVCGCR